MKTKKLLVAVCLLLISATMLGTASFAWFSMNTQVDVEGIEVEAYSDSLFLEISKTGKDATDYNTSVSFSGAEAMLRLTKHGFLEDAVTLTAVAGSGNYKEGDDISKLYKKINDTVDSYHKYVPVTEDELTSASNLKGLYELEFIQKTEDTDVAAAGFTYYDFKAGKYVPVSVETGKSVKGYYAVSGTPTAISGDTYFDGVGAYYKNDSGYYNVTSTLALGTDLSAYTQINGTADVDLTKAKGEVYIANGTGYSFYGKYDSETDISADVDTPYFGRAYSDVINDGDVNDTLSIIYNNKTAYYRMNTVWIRNAKNTNSSTNLDVAFKVGGAVNNLAPALRVLLVVYDVTNEKTLVNTVEYDNGNPGDVQYLNGTNIVDVLRGDLGQTLQVDIYVYFDGTDEIANNANIEAAALDGQIVDIEFTIDNHPYNKAP